MLQSERQQALKQVNSFLASKKCETLFSEIISLVTMEPQYQHEASRQAIIELAKKRIFKRYQKVCALGSNIKHDTPDDDVHELRIECKKLRYLMEFFSELFAKKPIIALIKAVKELQTILGNFNDHSVQKDFISQYSAKTKSSNLIAAASGFIAVLHQKQLEEKSRVVGAFENFSQQKVAGEFKRLFT
nr:CHAD domain-containing protein [Cellvibrionaceae bacterium]